MINKNIDSILGQFARFDDYNHKSFKCAIAALPDVIASMEQNEEILYVFGDRYVIFRKKDGTESAVYGINILTNKKYYFVGKDGKAVFSQPKIWAIDLQDIHSVSAGTKTIIGDYISFELKNDDYELRLGAFLKYGEIKPHFDEIIKIAKEQKNAPIVTQAALSPADELKKFKELLDMGIITQEEFDAKKKQLLGL